MLEKLDNKPSRSRLPRPLLWMLAGLAFLALLLSLIALVLPAIVNRDSVISRAETELSAWVGSEVHINGGVELSFIPVVQAHLYDVATSDPSNPLSINAAQVDMQFSLFDMLIGNVVAKSVKIKKGNITYRPVSERPLERLAAPLTVPIVAAMAQVSQNAASPDLSIIPNASLGTVSLVESTLTILLKNSSESRFSQLNATVKWPKLLSDLQFSGEAIWHGEPVQLNAAVSAPLLFAAGGGSVLDLDFKSPPLNFTFNGNASRASVFYADGQIKLLAPSLERFLQWSHADIDAGNSIGELSIASTLTTANGKLRFDDLKMSMSGNKATGSLELDPAVSPPKLSGTFAFDTVDLASLARAFSIATTGTARRDYSFFNQMDLDLRLSSDTANAGELAISDAAGAIHIANGGADFDLGDGTFAGGKMKAGLRLTGADKFKIADLRIALSDIAQEQIPFMPNEIPTLALPLSAELTLQGSFSSLGSLFDTGTGKFSVSTGSGTVRNFSIEGFVSSVQSGALFAFPTLYSGISALQSCTIEGAINNGVAVIEAGEINIGSKRVILAGAVPIHSRGLALNGVMTSNDNGANDGLLPFFLGGTWAEPYVTMMTSSKQ